MTKPVLNFVWFGPPRFTQGGQDVIGPETIDRNFKHFYPDVAERNPLVFWCQTAYQQDFQEYFTSIGVAILVCSIEEYLKSCPTEREHADMILGQYDKLVGPNGRNQSLDRVYMKDMFFNFLLATQGNYVLDTNVYATHDKKVTFPVYSQFMFPITGMGTLRQVAEVWIQYAPPENLARAKQCLRAYFLCLNEVELLLNENLEAPERHEYLGKIAVAAVKLVDTGVFKSTLSSVVTTEPVENWYCGELTQLSCIEVRELGVTKEYYNSHAPVHVQGYPPVFLHACYGNIEALRYDFAHGIDPNLRSSPRNSVEHLGYDSDNQSLLDFALRHQEIESDEVADACIQLLIKHGADPMASSILNYQEEPLQVTPFFASIDYCYKMNSTRAMVAFLHAVEPSLFVNQLVNIRPPDDGVSSPLLYAVCLDCYQAVELLLEQGAEPNQQWQDQLTTALVEAILHLNESIVRLLIDFGADVNLWVVEVEDDSLLLRYQPPLNCALMYGNEAIVQLLLENGADLSSPINFLDLSLQENLEISSGCSQLLMTAISHAKQKRASISLLQEQGLFADSSHDTKDSGAVTTPVNDSPASSQELPPSTPPAKKI